MVLNPEGMEVKPDGSEVMPEGRDVTPVGPSVAVPEVTTIVIFPVPMGAREVPVPVGPRGGVVEFA